MAAGRVTDIDMSAPPPAPSMFLALPLEIRLRIYEFVFSDNKAEVQVVGAPPDHRVRIHCRQRGLLNTCRRIQAETQHVWYAAEVSAVGHQPSLAPFLRQTRSEALAQIRSLTVQSHDLPALELELERERERQEYRLLSSLEQLTIHLTTGPGVSFQAEWEAHATDETLPSNYEVWDFVTDEVLHYHSWSSEIVRLVEMPARPFQLHFVVTAPEIMPLSMSSSSSVSRAAATVASSSSSSSTTTSVCFRVNFDLALVKWQCDPVPRLKSPPGVELDDDSEEEDGQKDEDDYEVDDDDKNDDRDGGGDRAEMEVEIGSHLHTTCNASEGKAFNGEATASVNALNSRSAPSLTTDRDSDDDDDNDERAESATSAADRAHQTNNNNNNDDDASIRSKEKKKRNWYRAPLSSGRSQLPIL